MKKNTFNRVVALSSVLAMTVPTIVFAKATSTAASASSSSSSSGGAKVERSKTTQAPVGGASTNQTQRGVECNLDKNQSKYFPAEFIRALTRDGDMPTIELRDNNKIMVKFPQILKTCGRVIPVPYQEKDHGNVSVLFKIWKEDASSPDKGKDLTYKEMLECLKTAKADPEKDPKIMDENEHIDHNSVPGANYTQYFDLLDYDFDKAKDVQKTVKVNFGFPSAFDDKTDPYGAVIGFDKDTPISPLGSTCFAAEKVQSDDLYANMGRKTLLDDIQKKCMSGNAQDIAQARKSIGNADALKDIADQLKSKLDAAYLVAVMSDVNDIYKKMEGIEKKVADNKDMDENTAKKLMKQYSDLAKELDEKFLNPAIFRLDQLTKQYADMEDGDAKSKLADEIKKLNEDIYGFAKRLRADSTTGPILYTLLEKYALNDQAKVIEGIRLKSYLYSKVAPGDIKNEARGKVLSFEEANQKQVKGEQNFDRTLNDWSDVYLVGKGNELPIRKTQREAQAAISKMNQRWNTYQQNEYKNYYQYCGTGMTGGVKNPTQCQTFLQGVDKRRNQELKRRERDLSYVKTRQEKLSKMDVSYTAYKQREAERTSRDEDFPYGSSYSGYETAFEENYPQFDLSTTAGIQTGGYNPQQYSMMGNNYAQQGTMMGNNMVALGNQSPNGYQMYNGQQGQYQYQMQQPQMMMSGVRY